MLAPPRTKPIKEPLKILLVNLIEDRSQSLLNDFVLQCSDAQRSLPSIGFRYVGSLRRLRPIRSQMHPAVQFRQPRFQFRLILFPRQPVHSWRSIPLQGEETVPQRTDRHMVEQRGELRPLLFTCNFTHTVQVAQLAGPALSPGAVARTMFSLAGRLPSMPSAGGCPPLFGHFTGTTQPSDSPSSCMLDFRLIAFSSQPT